jgi:hypothetical protein
LRETQGQQIVFRIVQKGAHEFSHPLPPVYYELVPRLDISLGESLEKGKLFLNIMRKRVGICLHSGYMCYCMRRGGGGRLGGEY